MQGLHAVGSMIALSFAMIAQAASAQGTEPPSGTGAAGADIIVTARRVEERLQDVPISITAFNQQQLANRNIVSAGDIATYTPSLSSNSRFGPEKTSFSIRGFNQDNGTAPSVGVYFADAPSLRAVTSTASGNGAGPGSFFDLQNVQVLKGPQGTLFGRNTSGGAVLIVPQRPTSRLGGYVEGSVGNYDMRRVQAVLNAPLGETARVRLGVDRQVRDGFMRNVSGRGPDRFNDVDYLALRASMVIDLSSNLETYFIGTYSESDTAGFLPRVFACNPGQAATSALVRLQCDQVARANARGFYTGENSVIDPYQKTAQFQFINTTTLRASDTLTVKNIASYGEYRERTRSTVYGENLVISSGPDAGLRASRVFSNPATGRDLAAQSTFTEELQFQGSSFGDRLTWQAGAYLEISDPLGFSGVAAVNTAVCADELVATGCRPFRAAAGAPPTSSSLSVRVNQYSFRDYALFGQGTFKLTERLSLTAGVRYTWDRYAATTRQININPFPAVALPPVGFCADGFRFGVRGSATNPGNLPEQACEVRLKGNSDAPTWVADLDYKPVEGVLLYAKYARGYRQGAIKAEGFGREAFQPEKIDNYEVGLKTSFGGAIRGTFNVAAYYNDFSNQQISTSGFFRVPGLTPAQLVTNVGKSRIKGVEVDASVTPFRGLTIDGGYAFLDTDVRSLVVPAPDAVFSSFATSGALVGYPLTLSPRHKFTVNGTYVLPLPESVGRVSAGATYSYSAKQYTTFQDTPVFLAGGIPRDYGLIPAIRLLNINLNWTGIGGTPVDLSLFATNVTKRRYATSVFGGYPSFALEAMAVGEPRMIGARLKYRFGD